MSRVAASGIAAAKQLSPTYAFIVSLAYRYVRPPARLLDFGCGAGNLVDLALNAGYDATGVDSFVGVWEQLAAAASSRGERILRIAPGEKLPFEDASFDIVVSNQVFEHIRDLTPVVAELARVLRPDGILIAVFPTREVFVEPHLKAPFVHWFAEGSALQRAALVASRAVGLGDCPQAARAQWVTGALGNLRTNMFYKDVPGALEAFGPCFDVKAREEAAFLRNRLALSKRLSACAKLPKAFDPLFATATIRLANAVFVLQRRDQEK